MSYDYRPTEAALMAQAQRLVTETIRRNGGRRNWQAPPPVDEDRSRRSLQSCHRYRLHEPKLYTVRESGAYVPELSARLENDRNLTDGARRCARKLAEYTYRKHRSTRTAEITVTYLEKALGRCRRTVQRYLRRLEEHGYIGVSVVHGGRSRMCLGLAVALLAPLFPKHRREKWPGKATFSDATTESRNKSFLNLEGQKHVRIPLHDWALQCMEGVWRSFNVAYPPARLAV
jgi:Helix-turn-helix domain